MQSLSRFLFSLALGMSAFAFGTVVSAAPVPPEPFEVTFPSAEYQITDTTATVHGHLMAHVNGSVVIVIRFGTTPQTMTTEVPAYSNASVVANTSYPFVLNFSGLLSGTTYYFYATDTANTTSYPVQQFTTTGTPPPPNIIPPSNANLSNTTYVTLPSAEQVITETSVTLSGHLTALATAPVRLGIAYGVSPSLMLTTDEVFESASMASGAQDTFTYTMANLTPGTGYYFQFRDLIRNTDSPLLYVKTKGGNGTGDGPHYGAYVLTDGTTNGVPPAGVPLVVEDPFENEGLVPCATDRNPGMCTFQDFLKLIGNVIDYALILLVPATAAICVYAGVSFIVSKGDAIKLKVAKERLVRVLIAAAVIMLAWAVVAGIYRALIPAELLDQYTLLDIF